MSAYDPMTFLDAEQMDALCGWWQGTEEPRLVLENHTISKGNLELTRQVAEDGLDAGVWITPTP